MATSTRGIVPNLMWGNVPMVNLKTGQWAPSGLALEVGRFPHIFESLIELIFYDLLIFLRLKLENLGQLLGDSDIMKDKEIFY